MLIVCPNCATSYRINPENLGETGRAVRCVTCHNLWFEQPRQFAAADDALGTDPDSVNPILIRSPLNDVIDLGETPEIEDAAGTSDNADFPDEPMFEAAPQESDAPSIVPAAEPVGHVHIDAPRHIERAAALRLGRRFPVRRLAQSMQTLPAVICLLALVLVCLIAARQQVVRVLPQTAALYSRIGLPVNLRGLAFENIKTARDMQDGVPMLVIEGDIVGTTGRHTEVPRLRFAVVDDSGKEIYAWTARPSRSLLPPGETLPFRSRLASPPAEANGISVRFYNRRDAQAGLM